MPRCPAEYWKANEKLVHITPSGVEFPETGLYPALQVACKGTVFEFGCGYGRLAGAFPADAYYGFDINVHAIEAATQRNPEHDFGFEWRPADTFLAYTVFLHIDDDEIGGVIESAKANYGRIVIGEIMGRQWRREGDPPVFNREAEEYGALVGWDYETIKVPYPRYRCDLDLMVFSK